MPQFGELEAAIMGAVWEAGRPLRVREVLDRISRDPEPAYNTVHTVTEILHRKGWLDRKRVGKAYSYWPTMTREERSANLMRDAFQSGGDADLVLNFFLQQMNDDESDQLKAALRKVSRRRRVT